MNEGNKRRLEPGDIVLVTVPDEAIEKNAHIRHLQGGVYVIEELWKTPSGYSVSGHEVGGIENRFIDPDWCELIAPANKLRADDPKAYAGSIRAKFQKLEDDLQLAYKRIRGFETFIGGSHLKTEMELKQELAGVRESLSLANKMLKGMAEQDTQEMERLEQELVEARARITELEEANRELKLEAQTERDARYSGVDCGQCGHNMDSHECAEEKCTCVGFEPAY